MNFGHICPNCQGAMQVSFRRKFEPVLDADRKDTGYLRMLCFPVGQHDEGTAMRAIPRDIAEGFVQYCGWDERADEKGVMRPCVVIEPRLATVGEKIPDGDFTAKNVNQLVELAVTLGETGARADWPRARLIAAIKSGQAKMAKAGVRGFERKELEPVAAK